MIQFFTAADDWDSHRKRREPWHDWHHGFLQRMENGLGAMILRNILRLHVALRTPTKKLSHSEYRKIQSTCLSIFGVPLWGNKGVFFFPFLKSPIAVLSVIKNLGISYEYGHTRRNCSVFFFPFWADHLYLLSWKLRVSCWTAKISTMGPR